MTQRLFDMTWPPPARETSRLPDMIVNPYICIIISLESCERIDSNRSFAMRPILVLLSVFSLPSRCQRTMINQTMMTIRKMPNLPTSACPIA